MLLKKCHRCLSENTISDGSARGVRYRYCKNCKMSYSEKTKVGDRISHNKRKKALIPCIYCNGNNVVVYQTIKDTGKLSYKCYDCFKHFSDSTPIPVNKEGFKRCCKCKQIKTIDSFADMSIQNNRMASNFREM